MGGSIPKEKYFKISYVVVTFPSLEEKCYILQEKNILMVLNADHQRYKITYGYRISLLLDNHCCSYMLMIN